MLGLEPHPTCGFVAETYRSPLKIPADALPGSYEGDRSYGSALYFLVTPEAQIVMHRIRSDQLYHHYLGDPLEVLMLLPDGNGAVATVGPDLAAGMRPQLFIPGGTFHTSRLAPGVGYALLASTEWPGVEPPTSSTETSRPSSRPTPTSARRSTLLRGERGPESLPLVL